MTETPRTAASSGDHDVPPALRRKKSLARIRIRAAAACLVLFLAAAGIYALAAAVRLKGEGRGRTNVMIYGLTADGNRTDTMLLASYYWKERKLVLLNIPRDLYAMHDGSMTKIVSLYAVAKNRKPQDSAYPAQEVSDFISQEYGTPVDYWIVANMKAFKELVDDMGGVTVDVQRPFTDYQYPLDDYSGLMRPAPRFEAGSQTMNGTRALIFARSRHAAGPEGTDFARSRRQEMLIQALMAKMRRQGVLADVKKAGPFLRTLLDNFSTDLSVREIAKIVQVARGFDASSSVVMANWSNANGFLCDSTDGAGAYVLRYGIPGDCSAIAGVNSDSPYRLQAVKFVQDLLNAAGGKSGA